MADIETLTDEERYNMTDPASDAEIDVCRKALRIIDALTERLVEMGSCLQAAQKMLGALKVANDRAEAAEASIARARLILAEGRPVDSPESRLAHDLREALGE